MLVILFAVAGIPSEKVVEAHGTFLTTSCIKCKQPQPGPEVKDAIFSDKLPRCRRSGCYGLVKPDIVFFGEDLPRRFYYYLRDFPMADMLLVMGTSLEVRWFYCRFTHRPNIISSSPRYLLKQVRTHGPTLCP